MFLCDDTSPRVSEGIDLGHYISNTYDGMKGDVMVKRGQYIQKNCELLQDFKPCHPQLIAQVNNNYNNEPV